MGIVGVTQLQGPHFNPELVLLLYLCEVSDVFRRFCGFLTTPQNFPVGGLAALNCLSCECVCACVQGT